MSKKKSLWTGTFWNIWSSYAAFYFGRVNLSLVVPIILVAYKDLSLYSMGIVTTAGMIAYAVGQFLHGQISEKFNPFLYIIVGLFGSAIMNLVLGFTAGIFWLLVVGEVVDSAFQSMGWSSIVRANAYTSEDPEDSSTNLGTSYQFGNSIAWLVTAFVIGHYGWQWGFWLASVVMATRAITLYYTRPKIFRFKSKKLTQRLKLTISFPIFLSAISLCFLNMVRYGVISWIPTYLYREYKMPIEKVGINIFLIPMAGIIGTLLYNKFKWSKDITSLAYITLLGIVFLFFPQVNQTGMIVLLMLSGLFLYGPHVFLVTTMPSRFHNQSIVAASAGFIDGWGYVGSAIIGILVPFLLDVTGNWNVVFYLWSGLSFLIALIILSVYVRINGYRK